ncbi:hypothetical protein F7731_16830 [Cytobacillus depressus]|uniref:Solute-binding protein family 5 domain-containing protein n=1 Tax=Cytobacillus depressus TaxID=1602942 RepID=A0A6L3V208_9BACI|nr:ABC transporter substrate-binding protein [Cytobacillus depressus]KAB2332238.1 hypothetical protein F7731_16830 [Cytobacillus depressus]
MKKAISFFFAICTVLMLTACTAGTSGDGTTTNKNTSVQGKDGKTDKKDSLVIGFESDATTLLANWDVNYITTAQIRNIYDSVINRDPKTGELTPGLGVSWENIDDLTWRIKLREGVKFHNGADFNADAVKFNIDFILDEKNGSFYRSRWANVKEVKVLSPTEVEIITSKPFPNLLQYVASDLLIMEPGYVKEVGNDVAAKKPVGTGPYKLTDWVRDNHLKLEANEDYWQGTPNIKKLEFRYIPEFSARLSAFLSGEIDLFKNIPVDSISEIENSANSKIADVASSRINYLALNTLTEGPMQDIRVRKAINYAVDVDELLNSILNGHGTKMTGPLSIINSGYTETADYGYDPDKAIELLKEAGYEPKDLSLTLETPRGRYPMDSHVAQGIASQLQKIGVEVNVQVNEWGTHLEKIQNRKVGDMYILGWGPAYEAQSTIENLFTKVAPYSSFYDEKIEEHIYAANEIFDEEKRYEAFEKVQHELVEAAAWVPLWQQADLYAIRENLNFEPRVDEYFHAFDMSWK